MSGFEVLNSESLLRLTFSPEHFHEGGFKQTAVSLADLSERGFSVDRLDITDRSTIEQRIVEQSGRIPEQREIPVLSLIQCGDVRGEMDASGKPDFLVEASPVEGNPGHASIYSMDRQLGKGGLRKLRTKLLVHMSKGLIPFGEVFPSD